MDGRDPQRRDPGPPNVVIAVLDDSGFAELGCYGSDIATPNIDGLAARGIRYNRFHVTALCSPTRASLLTGRNSHAVGMGFLSEISMRSPGYTGRIPASAAMLPRLLRDAGYATFAAGKWHLAPGDAQSAAGPFDRWPLGVGFERYYGFLQGETNQWTPSLVQDNHLIDPPRAVAEGYHLTEDLTDRAIGFVNDVLHGAPGRPFFLYFAPGAMHAPHHVPSDWVAPYRGAFDDGWDELRQRTFRRQLETGIVPGNAILTERPSWITGWDQLSGSQRRRYARMQEVYAGFMTHTDAQIGRLLDALRSAEVLDNTLVVLLADNGASGEGGPHGMFNKHLHGVGALTEADDPLDSWGGPDTYPQYSWGWAWAGNTPFRRWKRYTWLGGTRTPLIVSWPGHIRARNEVRGQVCHVIDLMPTILDCCDVDPPAEVDGVRQQPIDGRSIAPTFDDPDAADPCDLQYFETTGSRSIIADGWKATTDHVGRGNPYERSLMEGSRSFEQDRWALFRLDQDFSEAVDLAPEHPDVVRRLQELWSAEAIRNDVLPLEDAMHARDPGMMSPPAYPPRRRSVFRPGASPIVERSLPSFRAGGRITADVDVAGADVEGVLCALGDWSGGFVLYLRGGDLTFALVSQGTAAHVSAPVSLVAGRHRVGCAIAPRSVDEMVLQLSVDDALVASAVAQATVPPIWQHGVGRLRIGHDAGLPVVRDYEPPFPWTGTVHSLTVEGLEADRPSATEAASSALQGE